MSTVVKSVSAATTRAAKPVGVAYLMGRVDHAFKRLMREQLKDLDLTVSQYTALSFLADEKSMSNARLAELAMISPQSAHEMVLLMEAKGWITRQPDNVDHRVIQIALSAQGRDLLSQGDMRVRAIEKDMLEGMHDEGLTALKQNLRLFLDNIKAQQN